MENRDLLGTETFSEREVEILSLLAQGLSNREIADRLYLAVETVKWYNKQLYTKLGVSSRTQAVAQAMEHGLLDTPQPAAGEPGAVVRHNLPAALTSFVGREQELEEIRALLEAARLLTLTGPGGSGKTRLALETARRELPHFKDGVWLANLAPIWDPAAVPDVIGEALRVGEKGEIPVMESLARFLANKEILLVLDNFEHLLEAAPVASRLLASAPGLKILATSRERLRISGEHEYAVQPLRLPEPGAHPDYDHLMEYDAVQLFVQRAQAAAPDFRLTAQCAPWVAQICARLDGLPLALELAAPRLKIFNPEDLAHQLGDLLGALARGPRDLPERQRTLRTTIDWSYELLDEGEKTLFRRMAVFQGGGTLQAIQQVCLEEQPAGALEGLASLIDKSLVVQKVTAAGDTIFTMLKIIHAYALERLEETGEFAAMMERHSGYYAGLTEQAEDEMRGPRQDYWFARLRSEMDNLRAALEWSLERPNPEAGLRIVTGLRDFWFYVAFPAEGVRWAQLAIERAAEADIDLQAGVYHTLGWVALALRDFRTGKDANRKSLELYRRSGNRRRAAWAMVCLASQSIGNLEETPAAIALAEEGRALLREFGDLPGQAQALNILGELTRLAGDDERAMTYYRESLALSQQTGESLRIAMLYANMGVIANRQGEPHLAIQLLQKALRIAREQAHSAGIAIYLAEISGPLGATGRAGEGARLLGASDQILETLGSRHQMGDVQDIEGFRRSIQLALGDETYERLYAEGRSWSQERAYQYTLSMQAAS